MTSKDLIKGILVLGTELEAAEGVAALMIMDDMEALVYKYIVEL